MNRTRQALCMTLLGVALLMGVIGCVPVTPVPTPPLVAPVEHPAATPVPTRTPSQETSMTVTPDTLKQGDQWSVRMGPLFAVISGPEGWERFLRQHRGRVQDWPPVDWERQVVLVALMGPQRTGGYRITMAEVTVAGNVVTVQVQERRPAPGERVIQVLTAPYHVVTIPRAVWPEGPADVRFISPSGMWRIQVPNLEEDGVFAPE